MKTKSLLTWIAVAIAGLSVGISICLYVSHKQRLDTVLALKKQENKIIKSLLGSIYSGEREDALVKELLRNIANDKRISDQAASELHALFQRLNESEGRADYHKYVMDAITVVNREIRRQLGDRLLDATIAYNWLDEKGELGTTVLFTRDDQ